MVVVDGTIVNTKPKLSLSEVHQIGTVGYEAEPKPSWSELQKAEPEPRVGVTRGEVVDNVVGGGVELTDPKLEDNLNYEDVPELLSGGGLEDNLSYEDDLQRPNETEDNLTLQLKMTCAQTESQSVRGETDSLHGLGGQCVSEETLCRADVKVLPTETVVQCERQRDKCVSHGCEMRRTVARKSIWHLVNGTLGLRSIAEVSWSCDKSRNLSLSTLESPQPAAANKGRNYKPNISQHGQM